MQLILGFVGETNHRPRTRAVHGQMRSGRSDVHDSRLNGLLANGAVNPDGICCTIRIGTGRSPGSMGRISCKAFGPPVEVPIATIEGVECGASRVAVVTDWGGFRGMTCNSREHGESAATLIFAIKSSRR